MYLPASIKFSVNKQKGIIHIPILVILLVVASATAILITQNPNPNTKGVMIAHEGGEDDDRSGSSGSSKQPQPEAGQPMAEKSGETKTEVKFSEEEKIKTETKDDRTRIDVYSGGVKVRYEIRDGRVTVKAETEGGAGVPEQELFKIVDRVDKSGIKIATAGGEILVARNQVGALSNFPLQVDLNTNQLIVTTPAGQKVVTILPDQAVQNMLAANVINRLGGQALATAALTEKVASISGVVQLGLQNNIPVYEIPGIRDFKLLGFIPVSTPVTAVVSAETGELITTQQSFLTRVVDLLSP